MNEKMKLLWNEALKMNTVHVYDVVAAAWKLANYENSIGEIYNIVDDSDTTQGTLSNILANIFNVKVNYWGITFSNLAKVSTNLIIHFLIHLVFKENLIIFIR